MTELTEPELKLRKTLIYKQGCFANLSSEEIDVLATLMYEVKFIAGDTIVKQGDRVDCIYIIVEGSADVLSSHIENHKSITEKVAELHENNAIGLSEYGFYSLTGQRTATVIATSDMVTLKLSIALFRGFALAHPHVNRVMREQAERL
jgi:CRP-like cAMP-binding protein